MLERAKIVKVTSHRVGEVEIKSQDETKAISKGGHELAAYGIT
jgi:hypothetical protein